MSSGVSIERIHAATWDSGEGAFRYGGRWNSKGVRAVYCSLDPATTILEIAVHTGFEALDTVPHMITAARIADIAEVHVVKPDDVPNANWLRSGDSERGPTGLRRRSSPPHRFVAIPSVVSTHSWNLIFDPVKAGGVL